MYAVIKTGGKQYRVKLGDTITVEKLNVEVGKDVTFEEVLVMGEGSDIKVGTPFIDGVTVGAKVVDAGKGQKVIIYKHKAKKDYRRKQGHRQPFTSVEITRIGDEKAAKKVEPKKAEAPKEKAPAKVEATKEKAPAKAEATKEKAPAKAEAPVEKASNVNLNAMKKDELLEYAASKGIKVSASSTKAVIIEAIEAAK